MLWKTSELINVFQDTQLIIENGPVLLRKTGESSQNTRQYPEGFVSQRKTVKSDSCHIICLEGTSFACAKRFADGKDNIAVLNFANPFEPGGGVCRGSRAQEECLCRCSNLYNTIRTPEMEASYYDHHNADRHNYLFSDRIIYSPRIVVFKDDSTYERLSDPFIVDVITCAAPYNVFGNDIELLKSTYRKRLTNIFEVASENDVDVLILGAFGCGVFHNPPELMANAFTELIEQEYYKYFKTICFPLIKSGISRNFEIFEQILAEIRL